MPARFTRLRIAGFKSFADAVTIEILPGLTGIVGPNGCGKSNVADALRWSMGEASAKSLRGGEMDDVIFAGTLSRPARGLAEVSLTLTETAGLASAPFQGEPELQISRKIERGGGSTYRINGRETRARDVATLFADLASGARNSAMISQGRVSALVNARPEERRSLLEEAAGITGLHARRHEAELKLRAAEQNMLRAEDLRTQQEVRLAELRKQARQANRYRNISGLLRDAEAEYLAIEQAITDRHQADANAALAEAEASVRAAENARDSLLALEHDGNSVLPALRAREGDLRTRLERAKIQMEQIEAEIERLRIARGEAESRVTVIERDCDHATRIAADAQAAIVRVTNEKAVLAGEQQAAPAAIASATQAVQESAEALKQREEAAQRSAEAAAHLSTLLQTIEKRLTEARDKAAKARKRASEAATAYGQAIGALIPSAQLEAATEAQAAAEIRLQTAETALAESREAVREAEITRAEAEAELAAARKSASDAESANARLRAETDALAALLTQKFGREPSPVLDAVNVPSGLENALGAALRDELSASTQADTSRYWQTLPPVSRPNDLPCISAFIGAPASLQRALDHIVLLPEHADGASLQQQLAPGQILVSKDGALWRWDGFTMRAGAPTEAAVRLAQRNRLAELRRNLETVTAQAIRSEAERRTAETAEKAARQAEHDARNRRRQAEITLDRARTEAGQRAGAASRLKSEAENLATRAATAAEFRTRLEIEDSEAQAALMAVEAERRALGDVEASRIDFERARIALNECRRDDRQSNQTLQRLIAEATQRDHRLSALKNESDAWTERALEAEQRRIDLAARLHEARAALASLAADAGAAERRELARAELDEVQGAYLNAAGALQEAEQAGRHAAIAAREAEQNLARARESRIIAESHVREANHAHGVIAERILERFGVDPSLPAIVDATSEAAERARKRLERLTRERDEMGPVNLRADIEVGEIEAHLDAIVRDREEIVGAIAKLRGSIGHLNREGRERLSSIFAEIDRHFQALFIRMFGGGRAHLALTGSDDPLEAGLEIFAEPPGKKLATLSLLSGGEQALTALSLIFAVFRCNPAPISVLDEVDAPLDDANVDRFCLLLEDIARDTDTRFLVVTHHHLTMARMDRLYGVTMQERGVSRILSVDLGTATAMVEQANVLAAE